VLRSARRLANVLGWRHSKVFAIGFNKTGTTSIHALFESFGLPSYHGVDWRSLRDTSLLRRYDCFTDGAPGDLDELDQRFPGARFILQVRELDDWVLSRLAHIAREKTRGVHVADPGWDTTDDAVLGWIVRRHAYHLRVLDHFAERPKDLLVVNFVRDREAATRIARFLGFASTPSRPERNRRAPGPPSPAHMDMLLRGLAVFGVPRHESRNDICCPTMLNDGERLRYPADTRLMGTTR
jgi:hypothetical protein